VRDRGRRPRKSKKLRTTSPTAVRTVMFQYTILRVIKKMRAACQYTQSRTWSLIQKAASTIKRATGIKPKVRKISLRT
jgi:hypothetical protein